MKNNSLIYLDCQATTPLDPRVLTAMESAYQLHWGNAGSREHFVGWEANKALEKSLQCVANSIGADRDEIIITSGATEANNLAILGLASNPSKSRNKIIISSIEHPSVYEAARAAARTCGCELVIIPVNNQGVISYDDFEKMLDEQTLLVSISAVNNEIGTIQDIHKIKLLCEKFGAIFHSDSVHAPLCFSLSTDDADILSLSSHKIYGPKGVGALYIRRDIQNLIRPLFYGGGQQFGLRPGTVPVPLCVGFAKSIEILSSEEAKTERLRIAELRDLFVRKTISFDEQFFANGSLDSIKHPGNANICFAGYDAQELLSIIQPTLSASSGSACHSGIMEPSHVLKEIGLSDEHANASIRFGIGRFTTENNIFEACDILEAALHKAKRR